MGVAGVGVGAVLRALPAPRCGCAGPRRGARGTRRGHPLRRRLGGGHGVVSWGRGAACWGFGLSSLCAWGPLPGRGLRVHGLGGGGGLLGRRGLLGQRLRVSGGPPGLPGRRPDGHRCLRQPPRLALGESLPAHPGETGEREPDR